MSNSTISQIQINGSTYDIMDATSRSAIGDTTSGLIKRVTDLESSVAITKKNLTDNTYTLDLGTNNTTDTWVLVMKNTSIQHRVIPAALPTGVKGNAESAYRTGNVNLTPANIGASASNHNHDSNYAAKSWTTLTSGGYNATLSYSLSGKSEVMFVALVGTSYLGSCVLPVGMLHASTAREVYLTGGYHSNTQGRDFAFNATTTRATIAVHRIDNADASSGTYYVCAR